MGEEWVPAVENGTVVWGGMVVALGNEYMVAAAAAWSAVDDWWATGGFRFSSPFQASVYLSPISWGFFFGGFRAPFEFYCFSSFIFFRPNPTFILCSSLVGPSGVLLR
jgi:hypothetical protein